MIFTIKSKEVLVDNAYADILGITNGGYSTWFINDWNYVRGYINGKKQYLHRLIAEAAGIDISQQIDHINGNKLDNRVCNLRPATKSENGFNRGKQSNNTSGYKGVSWSNRDQRWVAEITIAGKGKYIGKFINVEDAAAAYAKAAREHHGKFYYGGDTIAL